MFTTDQAAAIAPKGTQVQMGNGARYIVEGHSAVPVAKAYDNADGDKVDVRLRDERTGGRTAIRATAEVLSKIVANAAN